jgi:hypothetical protein
MGRIGKSHFSDQLSVTIIGEFEGVAEALSFRYREEATPSKTLSKAVIISIVTMNKLAISMIDSCNSSFGQF